MSLWTHWRCGAFVALLATAACVPVAERESRPAPPPATPPVPAPPPPQRVRHDLVLTGAAEQGAVITGRASPGVRSLTLDGAPVPVARDGAFLLGFDRDAGTEAELVATFADGQRIVRPIAVAAGRWRIEHVDAPWRGGATSDADFARRRPAELAAIAAARCCNSSGGGSA